MTEKDKDDESKLSRVQLKTAGIIIVVGLFVYFGYYLWQQQQTLNQTTQTLQQLQADSASSTLQNQQKISQLEQQAQSAKKPTSSQSNESSSVIISSADLAPLVTGVNEIICGHESTSYILGSGSLWNFNGKYTILTNHHVVESPGLNGFCDVEAWDSNGISLGLFEIDTNQAKNWNSYTDIADLQLMPLNPPIQLPACANNSLGHCADITELNFSISKLSLCPAQMPLNSPVTVVGYPVSTMQVTNLSNGETAYGSNRTVTNGVISAYDNSVEPNLPDPNYYVSAKIDSGNSGGIALSKYQGSLCVLGIPTWVSIGNYETEGLVQNINNITYVPN